MKNFDFTDSARLWIALLGAPLVILGVVLCTLSGSGTHETLPAIGGVSGVVESSLVEQWAAVTAAFVVKPLYMLLALGMIALLWRSRSSDLSSLRWGLIVFLAGESACAVNYQLGGSSLLAEQLHSAGMAVAFGFVVYALLESIDRRIIHYEDLSRRCAAVELCGSCAKTDDVSCGLRRVFLLIIPALMILCLLPLSAETVSLQYSTVILGTPYTYTHPSLFQSFETRLCPAYALVFLGLSLITMLVVGHKGVAGAKVLFAVGLGPLLFGLFRLAITRMFANNLLWSTVWEEGTELIFILSVLAILFVFRQTLLSQETDAEASIRDKRYQNERL